MGMNHPNPNSRNWSKAPRLGRSIVPDDPRMADHLYHPTKGFKKISAKRSRAAEIIRQMAAGQPRAFVLGGGPVKRFIAEGY